MHLIKLPDNGYVQFQSSLFSHLYLSISLHYQEERINFHFFYPEEVDRMNKISTIEFLVWMSAVWRFGHPELFGCMELLVRNYQSVRLYVRFNSISCYHDIVKLMGSRDCKFAIKVTPLDTRKIQCSDFLLSFHKKSSDARTNLYFDLFEIMHKLSVEDLYEKKNMTDA